MMPKLIFICLILLLGSHLTGPVYAGDFTHVTRLIKQNKLKEAYKILSTEEVHHIGEADYDLLLARAALAAGHPHEAIFAFERVLINRPNNQLARVELAVAYYQTNELESSRQLFHTALNANPPDKLKANINKYIVRINEKIGSRQHKLSGILTLKQGWDSNINSATNESEIELAIGTYRPTEGVDKETSDTFTEVINRLKYNYHFNINSEFFSSLGYSNRDNNNKKFDTQTADARLGYGHKTDFGRISVPLSYQTMWLDEKQLRETTTISTNLNRSGEGVFSDYNLQYGEIRYPDQPALDVDFVAASFSLGTTANKSGFNQQYAIFYGDESPTNSLYKFNAREYMGLQVRLPIRVSQRHFIIPRVIYQVAEYKQRHPFFTEKRKDHYYATELNWRWYFDRQWNLTTQASHTESDSSVALYTHSRNMVFVGLNYLY